MKTLITLLSGLLLVLGIMSAGSAATFDFVSYADSDADNDGHGEWGYETGFSATESGIKLTAKAKYKDDSWKKAYVYLDKGNAGMGVCKVLDEHQCAPSGDDNVTPKEMLKLAFDRVVRLDEIKFRNGTHEESFAKDATFKLKVDKSDWTTYSLKNLFTKILIGRTFKLKNMNSSDESEDHSDSDDNGYQFYISSMTVSAVPIPAAIWLFGSALFGFVAMRKNLKPATKLMA